MSLLEEIVASLPAAPQPVRHVMLGIHWTTVCSRYCGLASTLTSEHLEHVDLDGVGAYTKRSAQELARMALTGNHLERSIGVAALNSMMDVEALRPVELNAYNWLFDHVAGKTVTIVGHFAFVDHVRSLAKETWVLERNPRPGDIPAEQSAPYLGKAEIIAITGSAVVNGSMDDVLAMCNPAATIMVLGPSTPLSPLLFEHGVSILSGSQVTDEDAALLTIAEGGGYSQLMGVKRVTIFK
jgi:uncharacterized protein (DUF4213/DUF364 family)